MTEKNETGRPVNIKQKPSVDALADTIARIIRAMEEGKEIEKKC